MKLKILSFDCEMLPSLNAMPNPEKSPIMLISFTANYDIMNEKRKVIFVLNRTKNNTNLSEGVTVRDGEHNDVIVRFNDERKMIRGWETVVQDCDCLTGYNIAGFDIPYICDRAKVLRVGQLKIGQSNDNLWTKKHISKGLSVVKIGGVKGKILFDVLYLIRRSDESNTIKKEYNLKSTKLEWTAKEVLKKEKKDFSIEEMIEYWDNGTNEEKFINYCSVDSELALEFITKFRLLDKMIMLSKESGKLMQDIIDSQGFGSLVEHLLMKEFRKIDRVISCRGRAFSNNDNEDSELGGAFVVEPKTGITNNLASGDYISLYPTLMRRGNLCYTTVILNNNIPDNDKTMNIIKDDLNIVTGRFIKPHILKGVIPSIQENLMTKRALIKFEMKKCEKGTTDYLMLDATQNAIKILLNSFYGYTGENGAKLFCYQVASSVTGSGRKQIKYTINMIDGKIVSYNGKNYKLILNAGDTDSVYVKIIPEDAKESLTRDIVVNVATIKFNEINETLEKPMKIEFENYVKRMIIIAKKRYTMVTVDNKGKEQIVNKGIESVRRDWCDFSTDAMTKVIDIILHEENILVGTKKAIDFIRNEADRLKNGKVNLQKLILSKKLTKPITLYDNKAVHVMVAIKMKYRGKPSEVGDRISYIIMDNGKKLIGEKAEEAEYIMQGKSKDKIDYNYYISKQLFPPIERILEVIGSDKKLLSLDKRQRLLLDYK